jgi:uroporphyrin-III C-methyltransferase
MRDDSADRARRANPGDGHDSPPRTPRTRSQDGGDDPATRASVLEESARASSGDCARVAGEREESRDGETEPSHLATAGSLPTEPSSGSVHLVGAGPGDPDLLTRRAWDLLRTADAVLHDSLTDRRLLDDLPERVEVFDVGKRSADAPSQAGINERLVTRAAAGEQVVRLKGGDPNVFGRGGEESEHLADADVKFEVVPGVSSAVAGPGIAGIPLTHREHASSVTVLTGHEDPAKPESALDWPALADQVTAGGTLVILMGVGRLPDNVEALVRAGVPEETPVAMVQKATWDDQRTVEGTLATIVDRRDAADIEPPAVTVVGDVVGVRSTVEDWLLND